MLTTTSAAFRLQDIIAEHYVESLAFLPMFALLLLLLFSAYLNYTIRTDLKKNMLLIIAVVISLVVQNYAEYRLAEGEVRWLARTLVSIYGYAIRPVSGSRRRIITWEDRCATCASMSARSCTHVSSS